MTVVLYDGEVFQWLVKIFEQMIWRIWNAGKSFQTDDLKHLNS